MSDHLLLDLLAKLDGCTTKITNSRIGYVGASTFYEGARDSNDQRCGTGRLYSNESGKDAEVLTSCLWDEDGLPSGDNATYTSPDGMEEYIGKITKGLYDGPGNRFQGGKMVFSGIFKGKITNHVRLIFNIYSSMSNIYYFYFFVFFIKNW